MKGRSKVPQLRSQPRARTRGRFAAILIAASIAFGSLAGTASALHLWNEYQFHSGSLGPQQGAGTDYPGCGNRIWGSRANWSATPKEMTAALINTSGGWVESARSGTGHVGVTVTPGQSLKAHCKNAETNYTFSSNCHYLIAWYDGGCA